MEATTTIRKMLKDGHIFVPEYQRAYSWDTELGGGKAMYVNVFLSDLEQYVSLPPFDYVAEHSEIEPSCFIYITDGCGPAPDRPPPYPVLWLLTGDGEKPAPWGWELRLK